MNYTQYIPVGRACRIAMALQKADLRQYALPFDWAVTPDSAPQKIIDFKQEWPDPNALKFSAPVERILVADKEYSSSQKISFSKHQGMVQPVFCQKTNILFPHEPYFECTSTAANNFVEKYTRRQARLQGLISSQPELIVVRDNTIPINDFQKNIYEGFLGPGSLDSLFDFSFQIKIAACKINVLSFEDLIANINYSATGTNSK